jgi:hypothetical protein
MIISHKYKYLFLEIPHTACTAISRELCEHYDGKSILRKHAHYYEFRKNAKAEEKDFFVFAGVRNPMDIVVTIYFKLKTDHQDFFTDPKYRQKYGGHVPETTLKKFKFIKTHQAEFSTFFKKFYQLPYNSWGHLSPDDLDLVIRFESLEADFAKTLYTLGIKQVRPLPMVNETSERGNDFYTYYTPDTYDRVAWVFGPHLKRWGYPMPPHLGNDRVPWLSQRLFQHLGIFRKYFTSRPSRYSRLFKKIISYWY